MKKIVMLSLLLSGFVASANLGNQTNCADSNFNGIEVGANYTELKYLKRFKQLYSGDSPAPAGIEPLHSEGHICFATTATYLKHLPSNKTYVMFTTGDDYCDGGNTTGVIVDMEAYVEQRLQESIVADIGDGEVICREK